MEKLVVSKPRPAPSYVADMAAIVTEEEVEEEEEEEMGA